jgi:cobalt/nickel transport system permease protein
MTLGFSPPPCPDSPLRRLDPRWKLGAFVVALVAIGLLRELVPAAVALVGCLLLVRLGRVPVQWFLSRIGLVLLFLSPFVLTLPLLMPGDSWWPGIRLALLITIKALALVTVAVVLFTSSPMTDTLKAAHALYLPGLLVQLIGMTYRYAFLVAGELARIRIALRSRGYRNRPTAHCYRTIGHVAGTLLVRSHERSERVAQAMRSRGFDGSYQSLHEFRTRFRDVVFFLLVTSLTAALVVWDWHGRPLA